MYRNYITSFSERKKVSLALSIAGFFTMFVVIIWLSLSYVEKKNNGNADNNENIETSLFSQISQDINMVFSRAEEEKNNLEAGKEREIVFDAKNPSQGIKSTTYVDMSARGGKIDVNETPSVKRLKQKYIDEEEKNTQKSEIISSSTVSNNNN